MNGLDDNYILVGHDPRKASWDEYVAWMKQGFDATKRVARTEIGDVSVSTVFLSIDHSWNGPPPILFETMVFGGEHSDDQWRYAPWAEAVDGNGAVVAALRDGTDWPS